MTLNRRRFLKTLSAGAVLAATPIVSRASAPPRVLVVGGGFAGATVAKYIRMWSGYTADVTLIDRRALHISCVLSNLILNQTLPFRELKLTYSNLESQHGIKLVQDTLKEIQGLNQRILLKNGGPMDYDILVVATGIGFKKPAGLDWNKNSHAWIAGGQTKLLTRQLAAMRSDSNFVMTIPKSPYRCPPGPYERACLVADFMIRRGLVAGEGPKVTVLDANPVIQAEKHTFSRAFETLYGEVLEYIPNARLDAVDSDQGIVYTSRGEYKGDVVNVIPQQRATGIVRREGLTGSGDWAPVDPTTYESTESSFPGVYVIGDSQNTNQPKSAHMANAQAKVCADAIVRELSGLPTDSSERLENITTNSACYSPITRNEASWLTANFFYDQDHDRMMLKHIGEAEEWNSENYQEMFAWAGNLFNDCFG